MDGGLAEAEDAGVEVAEWAELQCGDVSQGQRMSRKWPPTVHRQLSLPRPFHPQQQCPTPALSTASDPSLRRSREREGQTKGPKRMQAKQGEGEMTAARWAAEWL